MKSLLLIAVSLFIMNNHTVPNWDFLEWGMSVQDVEAALKTEGIDYKPLRPNARLRATKAKNYRGFDRLSFHYDTGLNQIQLYRSFEDKAAAKAFVTKQTELHKQFGQPKKKHNEERKLHTRTWKIGQSQVILNYFYDIKGVKGTNSQEVQLFYESID